MRSGSLVRSVSVFSLAAVLMAPLPALAAEAAVIQAQSTAPAVVPDLGRYPQSFADLAQQLLPAVVNISTLQTLDQGGQGGEGQPPEMEMPQLPPGSPFEDFFKDFMERGGRDGKPRKASALGSGFIIDAENGYIITNNHVIDGADQITVILQDDTNLPATLVGTDEKTDVAVLKVDPKAHPLVSVSWGDSDTMRVGDWVLAIGNPFGLGGTVTQGIISARARDINSGPYDDYLQTDASINRGNSGGPMFNLAGQVIGINTAIFSPSGGSIGIGFAVPSSLAKGVTAQIIQYGHTKRGWLGVRIQMVTKEIAESLDFGAPRGALVASVSPEGPAAKAGIQAGDIILSFDGKPVEEMRRLPRVVAETEIGKSVAVEVWRKGKVLSLKTSVAQLETAEENGLLTDKGKKPEKPVPGNEDKAEGLSLVSLTDDVRAHYDIADNVEGVLVTAVDENSAAAERDLREGDVIVEAAQTAVKSPKDFVAQVNSLRKAGRKSIFLLVERKGDLRFVALPLDEPKADKKPEDKKK